MTKHDKIRFLDFESSPISPDKSKIYLRLQMLCFTKILNMQSWNVNLKLAFVNMNINFLLQVR